MHIPDPRLEPIYSAARTHLAGTDLLMLETTKAGELAFHRRLTEDRSVTFITSGPNLEERLGKDAWSRLVPVLAEHQVPLFAARMMQPWFLGLALATPPCARSAQATGQKGLDRRLERLAQSADIPQAQLDDPDQLLAMLAGDPIEDQIDMMRRSLQGEVYRSNETAGLSALYFSQEPYLFWLASAEISRSTPGFDPDLLEEVWSELIVVRNQSWLPKILDVAKTQTVFVAVGALHLPTRDGVLHGLAEAGYTLRRLPVPSR
ncbi:MAG: TraB/GumN family protein [Pseudomonadota bacterium]